MDIGNFVNDGSRRLGTCFCGTFFFLIFIETSYLLKLVELKYHVATKIKIKIGILSSVIVECILQ